MAFSQGLLQGKLSCSLSKRGPSTYCELMERAEKYTTAEDISQTKIEDTPSEAQRSPGKQRRWFKSSTDRGKDRQTFRQVNTGSSSLPSRTPLRRRFDRYTPLKYPLERIFEIASNSGLLQTPEVMLTPPDKRNRKLHCKFHRDHGRETQNCNSLKDSIEELIRAGKLYEYVKQGDLVPDQPRDKGPMRGKAHCDDPNFDNEEPINFILTESVVGDSSSTSLGGRLSSICLTTTPEDHPGTWDSISFSPSDSTGVRYPHCEAFIISVKIRNRMVKRTLIDHGSSLDIIHWDPLQKLGYTMQQLQASLYCIRGIGGHRTRPVGQIDLPVRFGTRPCIRTLWVSFQVVDIPFQFNVLIGRPTLYALRAATSMYSLKMKFPTERGPGESSKDQEEYKRCIQIGSNPVLTVCNSVMTHIDLRLMGKVMRPKRKPFGSGADGNDSKCMLLEEIRVTSLDPREIGSQPSGQPTEPLVKADALAKLASTSDMKLPRIVTVFRLPESSIAEEPVVYVVIPEYSPDTDTWMAPIVRFLQDGVLPDEKNASLRSATGETPYSLAFGSEAVIPTELHIPIRRVSYYNPGDNEEELRGCLEEIDERQDQARIRTAYHQTRIAKYYNTRVRNRSFLPGDLVLKKVIPSTRIPSSGSLGDSWEGPYIVSSASMKGAYKLKTEEGIPLKNPWNAEHLKKYYQ
ncbi:hypothetical protein EZV62_010358 [Acer yangbiense]|uniref:Uncharacterized protein n=1 Tax=Acer yangbiense TaxID=1000413 RepID=A0A5C7I2L8_9ROSI|nr:hypothetical protein EZV62_010358 [Acer yangbiense]